MQSSVSDFRISVFKAHLRFTPTFPQVDPWLFTMAFLKRCTSIDVRYVISRPTASSKVPFPSTPSKLSCLGATSSPSFVIAGSSAIPVPTVKEPPSPREVSGSVHFVCISCPFVDFWSVPMLVCFSYLLSGSGQKHDGDVFINSWENISSRLHTRLRQHYARHHHCFLNQIYKTPEEVCATSISR